MWPKGRAVAGLVAGVGLSIAAVAAWMWMSAPIADSAAPEFNQVVQIPPAGRRVEELYSHATVVAQLQVLDVSGTSAVVQPLTVFKSDGQPIRNVVAPLIYCAPTFEAGTTYLVFAKRVIGDTGTVAVLDGQDRDEIDTYIAAVPGGRTARLLERLEELSGVRGYTGPMERLADGRRYGKCSPSPPPSIVTPGQLTTLNAG